MEGFEVPHGLLVAQKLFLSEQGFCEFATRVLGAQGSEVPQGLLAAQRLFLSAPGLFLDAQRASKGFVVAARAFRFLDSSMVRAALRCSWYGIR